MWVGDIVHFCSPLHPGLAVCFGLVTSITDASAGVPLLLAPPFILALGAEPRGESGGGKTRWARNAVPGPGGVSGVERGCTSASETLTFKSWE